MDLRLILCGKLCLALRPVNINYFFQALYFCFQYLKKKINQIAELRKVFVYRLDLELVEI